MAFDGGVSYDACGRAALACAPYAAALAVTLVLAAWLTPRRWWRRPNLGALAVLGGGTLAFGALFATLAGATGAAAPTPQPASASRALPLAAAAASRPAPGARYRVAYALNLRRAGGVGAARVAVLPAGSLVVATGVVDGDWWRVRAAADGREEGWASSLWLRRTDESGGAPLE